MKETAMILYQLKGFDWDKFVELYRNNVKAKDVREFELFIPLADTLFQGGYIDEDEWKQRKADEEARAEGKTVHYDAKLGVFKSTSKIISRGRYLLDAIIRRTMTKKDTNTFTLSSKVLKQVIPHDYKRILEVFTEMNVIQLGSDYKTDAVNKYSYYGIGKYSKLYTLLCNEYEEYYVEDAEIAKFKEKTKAELAKQEASVVDEMVNRYGKVFTDNYLISLRKVHIADMAGLDEYISVQVNENENARYYYKYVKQALVEQNKSISKVDPAGRVYHCLTNLDREMKKYLNIDFMLDCKNSHPVLFNYFIFQYYNIDYSSSYNIISYIKNISISLYDISLHNVGKFLKKSLIESNIEPISAKLLPDDALSYVYLTSNGLLWDDIASRHPEMDRNEVKKQMFQEVFYSHTAYAYSWKAYAVEFKKMFPSVYKLIGTWKSSKLPEGAKSYLEQNNLFPEKASASLSLAMMNLEAQIFTQVLRKMYSQGWRAVHIHDCIVVPEYKNNNRPNVEDVRTIMEEVYRLYGLSPTVA